MQCGLKCGLKNLSSFLLFVFQLSVKFLMIRTFVSFIIPMDQKSKHNQIKTLFRMGPEIHRDVECLFVLLNTFKLPWIF